MYMYYMYVYVCVYHGAGHHEHAVDGYHGVLGRVARQLQHPGHETHLQVGQLGGGGAGGGG